MGQLELLKKIELRRRSRVERARQMSSAIDVQAQIRMATDLSNLATEAARLKNIIGTMGENVPQIARDRLQHTEEAMASIREGEAAFVGIPAGPERLVLRAPQRTLTGAPSIPPTPKARPRQRNGGHSAASPSLMPYLRRHGE